MLTRVCAAWSPVAYTNAYGLKNLVQGELVNGSLGRVVYFATCSESRRAGILSTVSILESSLEAQVGPDGTSLEELRRLRRLPTDCRCYWPVVEFTNKRSVLCTPLPFDYVDASGDLEATRTQVAPVCMRTTIS